MRYLQWALKTRVLDPKVIGLSLGPNSQWLLMPFTPQGGEAHNTSEGIVGGFPQGTGHSTSPRPSARIPAELKCGARGGEAKEAGQTPRVQERL